MLDSIPTLAEYDAFTTKDAKLRPAVDRCVSFTKWLSQGLITNEEYLENVAMIATEAILKAS